jgi:5-histidylcysteine sulfoxide synthase
MEKNLNQSLFPVKINQICSDNLEEYFLNTWNLTELLFSSIKDINSYYINPDPRRHPLIFYFGHVAAFYINKLKIACLYSETINAHFENLFAVGVDPSTKDDLEKHGWPNYKEVVAFRAEVKKIILSIIQSPVLPNRIDWNSPYWALLIAIEHERIHFETSSVLIRQYDIEMVKKPKGWVYKLDYDFKPEVEFIKVKAGNVKFGRPSNSNMYGWDNEYGTKNCFVNSFEVSKNMVTNTDFLEFIKSGGYETKDYWSESGWNWVKEQNLSMPKFWIFREQKYYLRAMFDEIDMPGNWPVEVIAHEAEAFCRWKGENYRLLYESEWKLLTDNYFNDDFLDFDSYGKFNTNLIYGSPSPVGYFSLNSDHPNDLLGNIWEILSDDFYPLEGFKEHPYYKDFSVPFFDSDHGMMAGGSWASTGNSASRYYRLWFRRDFIQHAGFRLVKII